MKREPRVLTEYVDEYGDTRVIHRRPTGEIRVRRRRIPVTDVLSHRVAEFFGQRIGALRKERGWTQDEFMRRCGLTGSKQRFREMELATAGGPKIGTLYAVAIALNVPVASLIPEPSTMLSDGIVEHARPPTLRVVGES